MEFSNGVKKIIEETKNPSQSAERQSGFSSSVQGIIKQVNQYDLGKLDEPEPFKKSEYDKDVESGKTKYESDKSEFKSKHLPAGAMGVGANWEQVNKLQETPTNRAGWEGVQDRYIADMDEDTLKSFYTLYDKDADSALDFASEYQRLKAINKREEELAKNEQRYRDLGLKEGGVAEGVIKTAASLLTTPFTPIDAIAGLIDYGAGGGHFSEDFKAGNLTPFATTRREYQKDVKESISQAFPDVANDNWFRKNLGIENVAGTLYDIGYSTLESKLILGMFGKFGLAIYGTSAFTSSLLENLERDENGNPQMDDETALAKSFYAGIWEAATEIFSLEYFLKAKNAKGVVNKVRNWILAGLGEASEEVASEVANYVTDTLLRTDESDFAKAKAKYLAAGEDEDKAAWHAIQEFMPEAAYSALTGLFSGLLMQGTDMASKDVRGNINARSTIAGSKATGEYADLIEGLNASDYMEGKKPLTESSKTRDVVKAYRGATESIEQASIKDRLMEETTYAFENEAEATAKAIYDKANDYALSAAQKRLLGSQTAQKVLTEYTEGKKKPGTHKWVDRAVLSQQYATRSTKGESMSSETELGAELRAEEKARKTEAELSARESVLKVVSEQIGIDVKTLASQNINMPVETYENNLELAYSYGRAGYKLEDVAAKLGVDVSGVFGEAYQKGLEAYKSRSTEKSLRTKLGGKVNIVSQSELDKLNTRAIKETGQNPNYTEVNLSEMKKNNPMVYSAMEMVAKVYAPSIGRQVNFFSAENGVNGWRDASGIWINTDGVFEEYGKKGNVLGFFVHEFGHDLRADAPELFEEARQIIIDSAYKGNADALTKAAEGIILERGGDTKVDLEGAVEELVCDGLVKLTEDKEMLDKAFRTENLNFWKRFKNFLDKLVENFKKFLNTFTSANETARLLDVDAVQKLADVVGKYVDRIQAETKSSKSTETSTENKSETKQSVTHKAITYEEVKKARDDYNDARIAYSKLEADYNDRVRKIMSNGKSMDEQISEVAAEEKRLGVDKAKKALDEARKKYEATEKAYAEQQLEIEKEKERAAIEKSGLSEADYFRKLAKKEFGLTGNFRIAGYMLPSGSMLNFGAGSTTIRGEDHRRIGTIYTSDVTAEIASAGMLKFMNDGNIRVMAETPGVDISSKVEPTAQQYANIKRMAASLGKEERYFSVDFTDTESKYGDVVGVLEYENNINPERIVNDIKHYYATGEVRVPSTVGKFYSVPHISDEDYLKLATHPTENQELLQRIVDEYARGKGFSIKAYHGTTETFTRFEEEFQGKNYGGMLALGNGFYFAPTEENALFWANQGEGNQSRTKIIMSVYLNPKNILDVNDPVPGAKEYLKKTFGMSEFEAEFVSSRTYRFLRFLDTDKMYNSLQVQSVMKSLGVDAIQDIFGNGKYGEYVVYAPAQIKSADPVTYDNDGNVIPLSKRFDASSNDIRYSTPHTIDVTKATDEIIENKKQFSQNEDRRYSIMGTSAKIANMRAKKIAQTMETNGKDSESIRVATGWFKGYDGKWRFEADDSTAKLNTDLVLPKAFLWTKEHTRREADRAYDSWNTARKAASRVSKQYGRNSDQAKKALKEVRKLKKEYDAARDLSSRAQLNRFRLEDVLEHPILYKAYPEMKDVVVSFEPTNSVYLGSASGAMKSNTAQIIISLDRESSDDILSTLMHEVQHIIQREEGFAPGSNLDIEESMLKVQGYGEEKIKAARDTYNTLRDEFNEYIESFFKKHFSKSWDYRNLYGSQMEGYAGLLWRYSEIARYGWEEPDFDAKLDDLENQAKKYKRYDPNDFTTIYAYAADLENARKHVDAVVKNVQSGRTSEAFKNYMRSAGETESRDVQARLKLSAEERKSTRPDIDRTDRIVREPQKFSTPHTAPTFYSQMGKVIESKNQTKFEARSLINMLLGNGVKAEEIKWSGIATFLEGKKSVTKEELVDFVNKSKLQIEETWLGNGEWNESPELFEAARENVRQAALENLENQFEIGMLKNLSEAINTMRIDYENGAFMATAELDGNEITFFKENPRINVARWGDREYNLSPYNYRELLFRLPGATYTNKAMKVHWGKDASGILSHARIDDAWLNNPPTDPDTGEAYPMLFIEEIQSDWDNARHKREMARKLYRQLTDLMTEAKQNPGFEKADKRFESIKKKLENYMGFYIYADDGYLLDNDIVPYRLESSYDVILESDNEADIYDAIRAVIEMDIIGTGDIPDAPYGDGKYVEYTLKKLLRTAAEEGYTKIGWTTGKQQEERWSDEYAEAYRIEYDQQMPKFLNKYGKQWGATVSQEELSNGQMVWTFPITEAMRKSLIEIGQPLYSIKHRESSRMGVAMSNDIRDSIKHIDEFSLSPRQYLAAAALETIRDPADREELRKIIDEYQTLDDTKTDLEHQIAKLLIRQDELNADLQEIQQTLSKTSAAKSRIVTDLINRYGSTREAMSTIRTELKDIEKQLKNLRSEQGKVTARLHDILTMPRVESIIEEQRQLVREYRNLYQSTKEADKIKLQELRERMNQKLRAEIDKRIEMRKKMVADYNERKKIDYYMPRIEATLKDLNKHLAKAPMPFRGPVLQFISMLDFRQRDKEGNVRLTRKSGNEVVPHQANLERESRLAEIEALLGKDEESYGDIEKWFQTYGIPLDDDLKRYITNARNFLKNFVTANMLPVNMRAEDAAEIKSVYQFAKMLDRMLVIATKGYTDVALDQSKNSREIAEHIEPLERKNTKVSKLESFMSVDNAQPETIFDRLGEGGKKLFNILANGADRYAINRQIISDFAADWDKKQVREWQNPKEPVSVPFTTVDDEGNETVENVPMTPAQMMTLYATLQDPDGWRHIINGEGFQLDRIKIGADGKKGEQVDTTRKMTEKDYNALVEKMNAYDPDLIPFADKLHKFISDQGREWGNQVSIGRYGFEQFTQPKYFPLFTVEKGKSNTIDAIYSAMRQSFYGLLNRSFTKERLPNAVNALIIGDFFDIFIEHMSDMALYNAYALPVLEVNRFLNYVEYDVEKDEKGNEHLVEQWKMKDKLDKAFGTDIIENYIKNVFDSINGQEYLSRSDSLFLMGLKLRNRVAVTANVRVIVQQFFSIIRAGEVIPSKYLLQGGYNFKETRDEMYRYAPVANWKRQGNYNTDIKLPLKEELIGAETGYKRFVNAVSEYGMTPAEFMDEVAWTRIWHGVTEWVKNTNPGLSGEAFYDECNKRFRDIIYRTQVVDSVLQKSQFMRQQTFQARVLSSFKGEPTTSYNQLLRVVDMYKDAKQRGDLKTAWATIRPLALRAITAYCLNAIANAVVTSLVDMIRDDDDYETMWEKFIEALFGEYRKNTRFWRDNMTFGERVGAFTRWFQSLLRSNLVESFNPFDIPLLSDIFSLLQGYDADRADLMIAEQAFDLMGGIIKSVDGMDTKLVYDLVGAVSQLFGLPVQNVMRDSLATWNSVVGIWNELFGTTLNMKVQITPESAQSGYEALYDAMSKGKESRALELVTEIMDNVKDSDKAYNGITTQIRDAYKHNEITAKQAHDYLIAAYSYFDVHKKSFDTPAKLDKHIKDQVSGWDK